MGASSLIHQWTRCRKCFVTLSTFTFRVCQQILCIIWFWLQCTVNQNKQEKYVVNNDKIQNNRLPPIALRTAPVVFYCKSCGSNEHGYAWNQKSPSRNLSIDPVVAYCNSKCKYRLLVTVQWQWSIADRPRSQMLNDLLFLVTQPGQLIRDEVVPLDVWASLLHLYANYSFSMDMCVLQIRLCFRDSCSICTRYELSRLLRNFIRISV